MDMQRYDFFGDAQNIKYAHEAYKKMKILFAFFSFELLLCIGIDVKCASFPLTIEMTTL